MILDAARVENNWDKEWDGTVYQLNSSVNNGNSDHHKMGIAVY